MESTAIAEPVQQDNIQVNRVTLAQPWEWIEKGWQDMIRARK